MIFTTLGTHNFVCKPPIEVRCEAKLYLSSRDFSNGMWHATYTQRNQGDSRLLMVKNQIGNLTPGPSFGHNLCFNYSNGSCEPILNMHIPKSFQWYKELFNPMGFNPLTILWKFGSPSGFQLPKWELTWECGGSFPHILLHSSKHEMWLPCFTFGLHLCKPLFWLWHHPPSLLSSPAMKSSIGIVGMNATSIR